MTLKKHYQGTFDLDGLYIFKSILEKVFEARQLTVIDYLYFKTWVEKEIANYDFPDVEVMIKELQDKNIGYDFDKQKHTITSRTPIVKLRQYYISDKLLKNLGDISKVERLPRANFVTYSSPCQSFSVAGKLAGAAKTCTKCGHKWAIDFNNPDILIFRRSF